MQEADKLLWSVQVDHQLFALEKLDVTVSGLFFLFEIHIFTFICIDVLPVCMSVCHMYAWCPQRQEKGIRSPRTALTDSC